MEEHKPLSGAREANAGNDFHLLWAGKKVLELLSPNAKLKAVCVEGPTIDESNYIDADGDKLLAIDLAEYYDGESFETAEAVVFSQLKYSTRMATTPWTSSRLCESSNVARSNSIIRRLADTYKGYKEEYPDTVLLKLKIKLISNRPISPELKDALESCKQKICEQPTIVTKKLLESISKEYKSHIEKIYIATGLKSREFTGFLKVLDFTDCGTMARDLHKAEIIDQLGLWGVESVQNKYTNLMEYLRKQMQPEGKFSPSINRNLALSFFYSIYDEMFPAQSYIPPVKQYIKRETANQLIDMILDSTNTPICLHASGGTGKTTLVSHIENYLPKESIVCLYDCYGGGEYLQPAFPRHESSKAIMQICNDLALKCGTQFLFEKNLSNSDFLRHFIIRVELAIKSIKELDSNAVLVIVIDAIDNSFIAAQQNNDHCFAEDLMRQPLPKDVRLLVTCRTENLDVVNLPENAVQVEMTGFTLEESSEYLSRKHSEATEAECQEFHKLTFGNPRVQNYVLNQPHLRISDIINDLLPNGKNLFDVFDESIQRIKSKYGTQNENINLLCSTLISLPRPIPVEIAMNISNCSRGLLESLCSDLLFGIYVRNEFVYFKDEDFETFLRKRFGVETGSIANIANYMYQNRHTSTYCTRYVHDFLVKTSELRKLISIILDEDEGIRENLVDESEFNRVMMLRIYAAFRINEIFTPENRIDALKLIYMSTKFTKNDKAIRKLIYDNPDLSSEYCDETTIYQFFSVPAYKEYGFEILSKNAAVLSRFTAMQKQAVAFLDGSVGAIQRYFNTPKKDRRTSEYPTMNDIANIAECILRSEGISETIKWFSGWKPYPLIGLYELVRTLLERKEEHLIESLVSENQVKVSQKITIIAAYLSSNVTPPLQIVKYCIQVFKRIRFINSRSVNKKHLIMFLEHLASVPIFRECLNVIIDKIEIEYRTTLIPYLRDDDEVEFDFKLRFYVLKSVLSNQVVSADDLWNETELRDSKWSKKEIDERKRENKNVYDFLLRAYELRAKSILSVLSSHELKDSFNQFTSLLKRVYFEFRDVNGNAYKRLFSLCIADALIQSTQLHDTDLVDMLSSISEQTTLYRDSEIALSKLFLKKSCCHTLALELLDKNAKSPNEYPMSSTEQMEILISCARVARLIDFEIGRHYFIMALQAANDVDDESYDRLNLFHILASASATPAVIENPQLAHNFAQVAEDSYRRIGDSRHYPLKNVCETIVLLNPASVLGFGCRLDDRDDGDHFDLKNSMRYILPQLLKSDYIQPETTISLAAIFLPDDPDSYKESVQGVLHHRSVGLTRVTANKVLELIVNDILYHLPMNDKETLTDTVLEWSQRNGFYNEEHINKLKQLKEFLIQLPKDQIDYKSINKAEIKGITNWSEFVKDHPISSLGELRNALQKVNNEDKTIFLKKWSEGCHPSTHTSQLEILSEMAFDRDSGSYEKAIIANAVFERISTWTHNPLVQKWRNDADLQKKLFEKYTNSLLFGYEDTLSVYKKIFVVNNDSLQRWLLESFANLKEKETYKVVVLLSKIAETLGNRDALALLDWGVNLEEQHVHSRTGDGPFSDEYNITADESETVPMYLWKVFGHPDKQLRWSAAHSLRRLHYLGNHDVLSTLINLSTASIDVSYMDAQNYFFYESAKLWLFVTSERIAYDRPELISTYYDFFKEVATSSNVVHVLQRRVCKNIALHLARLYHKEDIAVLEVSDEPREDKISRTRKYSRADYSHKTNFEFSFDFMDTLPYWYERIGLLFNKSQEEVAKDCEYYINQFNINNSVVSAWSKRFRNNNNRYRSRNSRNDHGSIPEVEVIDKYAEWHSMFYVADRYRITLPIIEDADEYYTFNNWIERFTTDWHEIWSYELRDNVPYIPFFWTFNIMTDRSDSNQYKIPEKLADSLIFGNEEDRSSVVLNLSARSIHDKIEKRIRIISGFINKDLVDNLIKELQSPENYFDHYFWEDEEDGSDEKGIVLFPTCVQHKTLKDLGIEKHDTLKKQFDGELYSLSSLITQYCGYVGIDPIPYSLPSNKGKHPFGICYWSEPDLTGSYYKSSTYGDMAYIDKNILMSLLKDSDQALVLQISITFEDEIYEGKGILKEKAKEKRVFAIFPDGHIETSILDV